MLSGQATTVVPDTGILIELSRRPEAALEKERRGFRFVISAVAVSELARGVVARGEERFVRALMRGYQPVAPTAAQWLKCGEVLAQLRSEEHYDARGLQGIQNDVLIGLTARGIGLPVLTTNAADFRLVARHVRGLVVLDLRG